MMGNSNNSSNSKGKSMSPKKEMLKKMKPPSEDQLDQFELELSSGGEDEGEDTSEGDMPEMESAPSESPMLADASDEELMAEMKKRGLSAELEMESPESAPESM